MRRKLGTVLLVLLASSILVPIVLSCAGGARTLSLVQGPLSCGGGTNCTCTTSSSATCTMTVNSQPAAGNLDLFSCISFSNPLGRNQISSVSAGGTLLQSLATFGNQLSGTAEGVSYILPSTSTGVASTTVTITMQVSGSNNCSFYEYHPSANPNNVGVDLDMALANASTASPVGPAGTFSGTGDVMLQTYFSEGGFQSPTAVTSPYNTNQYFGNDWGSATAIPATGAIVPTWAIPSAIPTGNFGIAFGFNPVSCVEQGIQSFASGINGNVPDAATLTSDTHGGAQEGIWGVDTASGSNQVFYSNAEPMPFLNATGRMCNGENYSTASGIGLAVTGDGTSSTQKVTYRWSGNTSNTGTANSVTLAFNFLEDLTNSDLGDNDCAALTGQTGITGSVLTLNCYNRGGIQRALGIELNVPCITATHPEVFINVNPNTEYHVELQVVPNVSSAMYIYLMNGTLVGSTVYSASSCGSEVVGFSFGHETSTIPTGKHFYFSSIKWDITGTQPLIF